MLASQTHIENRPKDHRDIHTSRRTRKHASFVTKRLKIVTISVNLNTLADYNAYKAFTTRSSAVSTNAELQIFVYT